MGRAPFYRSLAPFREWWTLPRPADWAAECGRAAPLHVEIGCGNGDWLARQVGAEPDANWLGIEPEWSRVAKTLRKLSRVDARHCRVLCTGADPVLRRLCAPRSLASITCLFPEPWPNPRHAKHRLFGPALQTLCANRLVDGATLRVVTDDGDYADFVQAAAVPSFACARDTVGPEHGTWFERLWLSKGQPTFHELRFTKVAHPAVGVPEDVDMHTHRCEQFTPERFTPADVRGRPDAGEIAVAFKEHCFDPERRLALVRATVAEPDLVQHLWVEVREHLGRWHIRPAKACGFVPTAGVQRCLDAVRDSVLASVAVD